VGGYQATFTITNDIYIWENSGSFLNISGIGYLTLEGYDATNASFSLTSTDTNANRGTSGSSGYSFVVTTYNTPEPTSLLLLGSGILGLAGVLRRKIARQQL
jgi:hypothetical protein